MCMIAGYVRVSTQTQSEQGYGLKDQQDAIRDYCRTNGITLDRIFADEGISGRIDDTDDDDALSKRTALIELFASIEDGGTIIVKNTSRLWRSDMAKALIRRQIMKRNIRVISIEQPRFDLYSENPNDRFFATLMEAVDELERAQIAIRLAKGRKAKARTGSKPAGVCPYGYTYSADKKNIVIVDDEAKVIKRIFSEAMKGRSLAKIAEGLNMDGLQTRRGAWTSGGLSVILHNQFYCGTLTHDGVAYAGTHEPIISKITFGKVQSQMEKRQRNKDEKSMWKLRIQYVNPHENRDNSVEVTPM